MGYVRRTASSFTQFVVVETVKITRHTTGSVTNNPVLYQKGCQHVVENWRIYESHLT